MRLRLTIQYFFGLPIMAILSGSLYQPLATAQTSDFSTENNPFAEPSGEPPNELLPFGELPFEAAPPIEPIRWSANTGLQLRSAVISPRENDYTLSLNANADIGYALSEHSSFSLSLGGAKQLYDEQLWLFNRASVAFNTGGPLFEASNIQLGLSYDLPVSKDALRYEDALGSLGASVTLNYRVAQGRHNVDLSAGLSFSRSLYRYTSTKGGDPLVRDALTPSLGIAYSPGSGVSLSLNFANSSARDFNGQRYDDQYSLVETLSYQIAERKTLIFGHTNNGNTFDYGGTATNVRLYDSNRSQVFVGGSYVIY